jgi:hypothetical protein
MRSLLPVAALAALALLVTGCGSASSTVLGAALSSTAGSASGHVVYLAEGGSAGGTALHAPGCAAGCQLSGDGTTSLRGMTWPTWNATIAVGSGTEKLDDCTPDCAQGTLHAVPVAVTLSRPVMVCVAGTRKWYWTRASFTWPDGLPAAFTGANAPLNPFDYPGLVAQSAKSCR